MKISKAAKAASSLSSLAGSTAPSSGVQQEGRVRFGVDIGADRPTLVRHLDREITDHAARFVAVIARDLPEPLTILQQARQRLW